MNTTIRNSNVRNCVLLGLLVCVIGGPNRPAGLAQPALDPSVLPVAMVPVPPGSFVMGSPDDEQDRDSDEGPQTAVTFQSLSGPSTTTVRAWVE